MAALIFLGLLGMALHDLTTPTPPPWFAWVMVFGFFAAFVFCTVAAYRAPRRAKNRPSLAPLQTAAFQGKLAEALGENAELLGQAAADLEQTEALLPSSPLEAAFAAELTREGNERMRRMVDLTIDTPGKYGLTMAQATVRVLEDGRWLGEVRRLVEATREGEVDSEGASTLGHLQAFVAAREEAVVELRS